MIHVDVLIIHSVTDQVDELIVRVIPPVKFPYEELCYNGRSSSTCANT